MASRDPIPTISVEWDSDEPVYRQIARGIRDLVGAGRLGPGDRLPPVRALASDLGVNLNTVARAYRALEEERFIAIRDRAGAEIVPPPPGPPGGSETGQRAELKELFLRLRQSGLTPRALRRLIEEELEALQERVSPDGSRRVP